MSDLRDALERLAGEWGTRQPGSGLYSLGWNDGRDLCAMDLRSLLASNPVSSPSPEARTAEPARHAHWCLATKAARTGTLEDCTDCDRVAAEITKDLERAPSPVQGEAAGSICAWDIRVICPVPSDVAIDCSTSCPLMPAVQGAETGTGGLPGRGRAR